jgi:hypothetical protein
MAVCDLCTRENSMAVCDLPRSFSKASFELNRFAVEKTLISNVFGRDGAPDGPGPMQTLDRYLTSVSLDVVA